MLICSSIGAFDETKTTPRAEIRRIESHFEENNRILHFACANRKHRRVQLETVCVVRVRCENPFNINRETMSFREIDGKRDQFRKYIESKGVIDGITKVLIKLIQAPEKPEHPMDFIRANLGATQADEKRIASLEKEVDDYKKEVSDLKTQLEAVKAKLGECEPRTDTAKEATDESPDALAPATDKNAPEKGPASSVGSASNGEDGGGGAKPDAVTDKSVADSEKAATPSSNAADTGDSTKATNESENADTGESTKAAATNNDDANKPATATAEPAANDDDKTKSDSGNDKAEPNASDKK